MALKAGYVGVKRFLLEKMFKDVDSEIEVTRQLIDDTVGWTGKNFAGDWKSWGINSEGVVVSSSGYYKCAVVKGNIGDVFTLSQEGTASAMVVAYYTSAPNIDSVSYDGSRVVFNNVRTATITFPINGYAVVRFDNTITKAQIERGSVVTAYEPYHASVEESKADISAIGDDESGRTTASRQYSAGEYFYKDGQNCRTKTDVASGATWTLDTNYEVKPIDEVISVTSGVATTTNTNVTLDDTVNIVKKFGNICAFKVRFTIANDITDSSATTLLKLPFTPIDDNLLPYFDIRDRNYPYPIKSACYITSIRNINIRDNLVAGTYDVSGIYMCQ